jgi:dTMP kinase
LALVPDLVLYLRIDVNSLIPRVLAGKGMDYWESGMHLALGSDMFDSFRNYQTRLIREYNALAREFQFTTIDARQPIADIQIQLRNHIRRFLRATKNGTKMRASEAKPLGPQDRSAPSTA